MWVSDLLLLLTTLIFSPPSVSFPPPPLFFLFLFFWPSVVAPTNCATSRFIPLFSSPVLNQSPMCASALFFPQQIWSPPSYATAQILHGLPLATIGTRHLSARTKLKCNSHFNIIVIVIMRHSLTFFPEAAFIFNFFFLCSFANQSLPFYFFCMGIFFIFIIIILFPHFSLLCLSLDLQKDSWPITGVSCSCFCVVLVCVVLPAAVAQLAGKYRALIHHPHRCHHHHHLHLHQSLQRLIDLMLPNFLTTRYQHRVLT